jgi:peptide/nickel transport system substrate-binding protein
MKRSLRWTLAASMLAALAMFVAACGSSSNDKGGTTAGQAQQSVPTTAKQGGKLTYLAAGDVDYIDPGQTYYTFGYMVLYATNRTLYSFKPDDSVNPVPDLATG